MEFKRGTCHQYLCSSQEFVEPRYPLLHRHEELVSVTPWCPLMSTPSLDPLVDIAPNVAHDPLGEKICLGLIRRIKLAPKLKSWSIWSIYLASNWLLFVHSCFCCTIFDWVAPRLMGDHTTPTPVVSSPNAMPQYFIRFRFCFTLILLNHWFSVCHHYNITYCSNRKDMNRPRKMNYPFNPSYLHAVNFFSWLC